MKYMLDSYKYLNIMLLTVNVLGNTLNIILLALASSCKLAPGAKATQSKGYRNVVPSLPKFDEHYHKVTPRTQNTSILPLTLAALDTSTMSPDDDKDLATQLLAASWQFLDSTGGRQFSQIANSGFVNIGDKQLQMTSSMHNFLKAILDSGAAIEVVSFARPGNGRHGVSIGSNNYVIAAIDIGGVGDTPSQNTMTILNPAAVQASVTRLMQSLPQMSLEIGFLRKPYPNGDSHAASQGARYKNSRVGSLFAGGFLIDDNVNRFYQFINYRYNEINVPGTSVDEWLNAIAPGPFASSQEQDDGIAFRQAIRDAVYEGQSRGAQLTALYGDALDHLHVTVVSADAINSKA